MENYERFHSVEGFILDVDGVLTDSNILITEDGHLLRSMSVRDGYAMKLALQNDYHFAVITGGSSIGVETRLQNLGIPFVFSGIQRKIDTFYIYVERQGIDISRTIYIGDDIPDLAIMNKVGVPCCPLDAVEAIKRMAYYISPFNGGHGCVRDIIEKVMKLQGKWPAPNFFH